MNMKMNMKYVVALLVLFLLFSCRKAESFAAPEQSVASPIVAPAADAQNAGVQLAGRGLPAGVEAAPRAMPRMIVRTAEMRIVVADTTKAIEAVTKSVEAMGGFVSGSNIWREGELLRATLKLRVPSDKLTSTLASIRGLASRVDNETIASEDVSQEYVDLESQVRNLEATETELRELLIVARKSSRKAADVLEVHEQLTIIRGQIEQAKGRMRYLSQVTALSQISLEVMPDAITKPVVEAGWQPFVIAKDAVRALVGALQSIATVGIWLLLYVVPIFGMLALVVVALWKIARRSRHVRSTEEA
ncbi:MAG: DUF4349 domain-containing protein [Acidobacteriota bacterium]|nr:DUF4349 domain-containing protein [Acidobacteriota bacterium]